MKSILSIVCIILSVQNSFAQLAEIKKYYLNINKAESYLINNKYREADSCYLIAFNTTIAPFNKDLLNYTKISSDFNGLKLVCRKLAERGFKKEEILKIENLKKFIRSKEGKILIENYSKIKPKYNLKLRKSIDSLNYLDQKYRQSDDCYSVFNNEIKHIDSLNGMWLKNLFKTYGFPSEEQLGFYTEDDYCPLFTLIFHHNYKARYRTVNFSEYLMEGIINGKINNKYGIMLFIRQGNEDVYGSEIGLLNAIYEAKNPTEQGNKNSTINKLYVTKYKKEKLEIYNQNRDSIYLDSIHENLQKQELQFITSENIRFVFCPFAIEVFHFNEMKSYEAFIKSLQLYEK